MFYLELYLILGFALLLVILWDFKTFKEAVLRSTKASEDESELPHAVLLVWNAALFVGHTLLLWPVIFYMEYIAVKNEK